MIFHFITWKQKETRSEEAPLMQIVLTMEKSVLFIFDNILGEKNLQLSPILIVFFILKRPQKGGIFSEFSRKKWNLL